MKKTVLVLITFALVIAVAGSGFWLVHYFIDSREQKETYKTLAEEFVLESTPGFNSTTPAESSSPIENSSEPAETVLYQARRGVSHETGHGHHPLGAGTRDFPSGLDQCVRTADRPSRRAAAGQPGESCRPCSANQRRGLRKSKAGISPSGTGRTAFQRERQEGVRLPAARAYERATRHDNYPFAAYALGCLYLRGQGVERDEKRALELFLTAAEHEKQPNAYAMYELGRMYRRGIGTEIDETKADYWEKLAYNAFVSIEKARPDDKLQYRLGYMVLHGIGTEPSPETAYQFWKKAVPLKNKDALYALGKLCLDPSFSGFSPQEGERYLWESWSKHKNLQAAYLLGKDYAQGTVLPRDMEKALELLATVAEKGNPYALYLLGKIYYWGNGVEQDRENGLEYIRQAEEQGHPGAVGFWERLAQWESQRSHEQAVPLFPLATRLLRQVGQIFGHQFSLDTPITRLVDKKLRQKIAEKKLAHGQKIEM